MIPILEKSIESMMKNYDKANLMMETKISFKTEINFVENISG